MNIEEAAMALHDAGYKDAHENLSIRAKHGMDITEEEYESYRTHRHMEAAFREFAEKIWREGFNAGLSEQLSVNLGCAPTISPYEEETP